MSLQNIVFNYDVKSDILYLSIGSPKKAICLELEEGILIRIAPDTKEIVGLTIIDFVYRFKGKKSLVLPILAQFDIPSKLIAVFED